MTGITASVAPECGRCSNFESIVDDLGSCLVHGPTRILTKGESCAEFELDVVALLREAAAQNTEAIQRLERTVNLLAKALGVEAK
jgi:hypothetical protein